MTIAQLIVDVSANTVKLQKSADEISTSMDKIGSLAKKAGAAIAGAFAVTEIIAAARAFLDLTGNLTDMAAKTGIGTTALQKLKYAAEQNGGTLEDVTKSIAKMASNLVNGDKSAVNALGQLGLKVSDIRAMKPEDAFTTIADAIAKVPDPMGQAALAMAVFGKSGADMLPMMKGNLKETAEQAEKMGLVLSEDVIKAGDDFGDTLGTLFTAGMALLGKVLGPFIPLLQLLADLALKAAGVIGPILGGAIEIVVAIGTKAVNWLVSMGQKMVDLISKVPGMSSVVAGMKTVFNDMATAAGDLKTAIVGVKPPAEAATSSLGNMKVAITPLKGAHDEAAKAAKEHTDKLKDFHLEIDNNLIPSVHRLGTEIAVIAPMMAQDAAAIVAALGNEAIPKAAARIGVEIQTSGDEFAAAAQGIIDDAVKAAQGIEGIGDAIANLGASGSGPIGSLIGGIGGMVMAWGRFSAAVAEGTQELTKAGKAMALINGAAAIGGSTGSGSTTERTIGGAMAGAQAGMMFGPYGALAGAVIGGVVGFVRGKMASAGRDAVEAFAEGMGGFDAVHAKLDELGPEGEQFWIRLTQGVGKNNPQQAAAVINEITEALERQRQKNAEVEDAASAATAAQSAAQDEVIGRINGLTAEYNQLWDSIKDEAPEEVMGVVEANTRARMDTIARERENAVNQLQTLTDNLEGGFDRVLSKLDTFIDRLGHIPAVNIPVHVNTPDSEGPEGAATGGRVGYGRVLPFAFGGFVPQGTDTVPAMLTPGEIILNAAQQRRVAGHMAGGITLNVTVDASGNDADAVARKVSDAIMVKLRREQRLNVA